MLSLLQVKVQIWTPVKLWKNYYQANTNPLYTKIDLKIYVDNTQTHYNIT
jgi:hypothetical protein